MLMDVVLKLLELGSAVVFTVWNADGCGAKVETKCPF